MSCGQRALINRVMRCNLNLSLHSLTSHHGSVEEGNGGDANHAEEVEQRNRRHGNRALDVCGVCLCVSEERYTKYTMERGTHHGVERRPRGTSILHQY